MLEIELVVTAKMVGVHTGPRWDSGIAETVHGGGCMLACDYMVVDDGVWYALGRAAWVHSDFVELA